MSIRADSLAAHGAEGWNGGDVRLGELQLPIRIKPLRSAEQRAAKAWCRTSTMQQLQDRRERHGGRVFLINGGKA